MHLAKQLSKKLRSFGQNYNGRASKIRTRDQVHNDSAFTAGSFGGLKELRNGLVEVTGIKNVSDPFHTADFDH